MNRNGASQFSSKSLTGWRLKLNNVFGKAVRAAPYNFLLGSGSGFQDRFRVGNEDQAHHVIMMLGVAFFQGDVARPLSAWYDRKSPIDSRVSRAAFQVGWALEFGRDPIDIIDLESSLRESFYIPFGPVVNL